MDRSELNRWHSLDQQGTVRWLKYSWGPGTANTLAVQLDDGTWMVISPASKPSPEVLDQLASDADVRALVAPNAFHHLGQNAWRMRFPEARSYAPQDALEPLASKSPQIPYRPISELAQCVGERVHFCVPDGMKRPDLLIRIRAAEICVWWLGDLFSTNTRKDQTTLLRLFANFAGSGPGYRRNSKPGLVYVSDPSSWLQSVARQISSDPPTIVVCAHGDIVDREAAAMTMKLLK